MARLRNVCAAAVLFAAKSIAVRIVISYVRRHAVRHALFVKRVFLFVRIVLFLVVIECLEAVLS